MQTSVMGNLITRRTIKIVKHVYRFQKEGTSFPP